MFTIYSNETGAVAPWEYYGVNDDLAAGQMAEQLTGGNLAEITTEMKTTPAYLCMGAKDKTTWLAPAVRVLPGTIYETTLKTAATSVKVGSKLEVSAGGLQVDAGAAGTFEVVYVEGTEAGSIVRGRFV